MAKGVANQVLRVYVEADLFNHPKILALMSAGHDVRRLPPEIEGADVLLSDRAHYFTQDMIDYLDDALTAARRRRKRSK